MALLVAGTMLLPSLALAQPMGPGGAGGRGGARMFAHVRTLDLTAPQQTQVDALEAEYRPKFQELRAQQRDIREEMISVRAAPTPAWNKLDALRTQLHQVRDRIQALRGEVQTKLLGLLTTEQQTRLWTSGPGWGKGGPGMGPGMGLRGGRGKGGGPGPGWGGGAGRGGGPGAGWGGGPCGGGGWGFGPLDGDDDL
jgi:Spy/CpxP family protein refolding chaperone